MTLKTENEKMLAGEIYNCLDPDLTNEREKVKELLRLYNLNGDTDERTSMLQKLLGGIGQDSMIESPFHCSYGRNIFMGNNVYLNFSCIILDNNEVHIGNHVMFGPAVQLYTAAHPLDAASRIKGLETAMKIIVEDNVWLGGGAIIQPGIVIGANAVVGAGAVVTKDVPPDTVVAGNPARVIRELSAK